MNSRQIRNVVSNAQQLALWQNKPLDYESLNKVVTSLWDFDCYVSSRKSRTQATRRNIEGREVEMQETLDSA
jgi:hypothetical protein